MLDLDKRSITYLPGVGPKKADILQRKRGYRRMRTCSFIFLINI